MGTVARYWPIVAALVIGALSGGAHGVVRAGLLCLLVTAFVVTMGRPRKGFTGWLFISFVLLGIAGIIAQLCGFFGGRL